MESDKVRTTKQVRMHLDLDLKNPLDAQALVGLGNVVDDVVGQFLSVHRAKVTEIIPAEGDRFHWPNSTKEAANEDR